jgi:hypothetical protein
MNSHDPLEVELHGLRPRGATAQWKRRIVERLQAPPAHSSKRSWGIGLAGALAAACLAAIGMWRSEVPRANPSGNISSGVVSVDERGESLPTVLAYRRALGRSPDDFTALLDRQSVVTLPHDPARNGLRAFIRPNEIHFPWRGEL